MISKITPRTCLIIPIIMSLSCVKEVQPTLPKAEPQLVVEALLNNRSEQQLIRLYKTKPYFSNSSQGDSIVGSKVSIKDNLGHTYPFVESSTAGEYIWSPTNGDKLGGQSTNRDITYTLTVTWEKDTYTAVSSLPKAPEIRSAEAVNNDYVEFVASDLSGQGNIYKIYAAITFERVVSGPTYFRSAHGDLVVDSDFASSLAQGFSSNKDGIEFSSRVRRIPISALNFRPRRVEVHAIPLEEALFIYDIAQQNNRNLNSGAGATAVFVTLFSAPTANVYSNIKNSDPKGKKGVGCFSVANVASKAIIKR